VEHRLDVEALRWHGVGDVLIRELFERGGLARIVETQYKDTEFLFSLLQLAQQRKQSHPVWPLSRAAQAASSVFPSAPHSLLSRRAVRCD
jgi:hypothetical protein